MVKKSKDYILSMYGLPGVLLEIKYSPFNHGEIKKNPFTILVNSVIIIFKIILQD